MASRAQEALAKAEGEREGARRAADGAHAAAATIKPGPEEQPQNVGPFDGTRELTRIGAGCSRQSVTFFLSISDGKVTSNLHGRGTVSSTGEFRLQNPADSRPTRLGKASFLHYKAESSLPCAGRNTMILELASMLSRVAVRFGHRTASTPLPRLCTRYVAANVCNNFARLSPSF